MSEAYDNEVMAAEAIANNGNLSRSKSSNRSKSKAGNRKTAAAKRSSATDRVEFREPRPWRSVLLGGLLLLACIGLGVQMARQSQQMRSLYSQLQQDQIAKDALLAEQSRLLIERGALSSYNNVERLATDELQMKFPEAITRVPVDATDGGRR